MPIYKTTRVGGTDHVPVFESRVELGDLFFTARGGSKQQAEDAAAKLALKGTLRPKWETAPGTKTGRTSIWNEGTKGEKLATTRGGPGFKNKSGKAKVVRKHLRAQKIRDNATELMEKATLYQKQSMELMVQAAAVEAATSSESDGDEVPDLFNSDSDLDEPAVDNEGVGLLVLVEQDTRVGLISERRDKPYCLIGGKVEQGETLEEAFRRELWEEARVSETGIDSRGVVAEKLPHDLSNWYDSQCEEGNVRHTCHYKVSRVRMACLTYFSVKDILAGRDQGRVAPYVARVLTHYRNSQRVVSQLNGHHGEYTGSDDVNDKPATSLVESVSFSPAATFADGLQRGTLYGEVFSPDNALTVYNFDLGLLPNAGPIQLMEVTTNLNCFFTSAQDSFDLEYSFAISDSSPPSGAFFPPIGALDSAILGLAVTPDAGSTNSTTRLPRGEALVDATNHLWFVVRVGTELASLMSLTVLISYVLSYGPAPDTVLISADYSAFDHNAPDSIELIRKRLNYQVTRQGLRGMFKSDKRPKLPDTFVPTTSIFDSGELVITSSSSAAGAYTNSSGHTQYLRLDSLCFSSTIGVPGTDYIGIAGTTFQAISINGGPSLGASVPIYTWYCPASQSTSIHLSPNCLFELPDTWELWIVYRGSFAGSFFMHFGYAYVLNEFNINPTLVSVSGAVDVNVLSAPPIVPSGVTDVNVVGMNQLAEPFWTSNVNPHANPINVPAVELISADPPVRRATLLLKAQAQHALNGNTTTVEITPIWHEDEKLSDAITRLREEFIRRGEVIPRLTSSAQPMKLTLEENFALAAGSADKVISRALEGSQGHEMSTLKCDGPDKRGVIVEYAPMSAGDVQAYIDTFANSLPLTEEVWVLYYNEIFGVETRLSNKYWPLMLYQEDTDIKDELRETLESKIPAAPAQTVKRRPPQTEQAIRTAEQAVERREQREKPKKLDGGALRRQRDAAIARVAKRLTTDDEVAAWLSLASPARPFAYAVTVAKWGADYAPTNWQRQAALYYVSENRRAEVHDALLLSLLLARRELDALRMTDGFYEWLRVSTTAEFSSLGEAVKVLQSEADANSQLVHALNGNINFSKTLTDVKANPSGDSLAQTGLTSATVNPQELVLAVSSTNSSIPLPEQSVPYTDVFHADVIRTNNAVALDRTAVPVEGQLYPRQVRALGGGALAASNQRTQWTCSAEVRVPGSAISRSELATTLFDMLERAAGANIRRDNTIIAGYRLADVVQLASMTSLYGFTPEAGLTKLLAIQRHMLWGQAQNLLPLGRQCQIWDSSNQVAPNANSQVNFNDSTIFGEGLGGTVAPVLPFRGGATGEVAFHLTYATVPRDQQEQAIFAPAFLCDVDNQTGLGLALIVAFWSDYPFVMPTVSMNTLDDQGANLQATRYIPNCGLHAIPGMATIHIILSRQGPNQDPTDDAEAAAMVFSQPRYGPTVIGAHGAGELININSVGNPLTGVALSDYLASWYNAMDSGSIIAWLARLKAVVSFNAALEEAIDRVRLTSTRYAPLMSDAVAARVRWDANTNVGSTQISALGFSVPRLTANLPLGNFPPATDIMRYMEPTGWNKLVLMLADSSVAPAMGELPMSVTYPTMLQHDRVSVRPYAAATTLHNAALGFPAALWDTAFNNTVLPTAAAIVRSHYARVSDGLVPQPTRGGSELSAMFTGIMEASPPRYMGQAALTAFDTVLTPVRANAHLWAYDNGQNGLNGCTPGLLPDVWIHLTVKKIPLSMSSIPGPGTFSAVTGLRAGDDWKLHKLNQGALQTSMMRPTALISAVPMGATRDLDEYEVWNMRLFHRSGLATLTDYAGNAIANVVPLANILRTPPAVLDYTHTNVEFDALAAGTWWIPAMTTNGTATYMAIVVANAVAPSNVQLGVALASFESWLTTGYSPTATLLDSVATVSSRWARMVKPVERVVSTAADKSLADIPGQAGVAAEVPKE